MFWGNFMTLRPKICNKLNQNADIIYIMIIFECILIKKIRDLVLRFLLQGISDLKTVGETILLTYYHLIYFQWYFDVYKEIYNIDGTSCKTRLVFPRLCSFSSCRLLLHWQRNEHGPPKSFGTPPT